MRYCNEDWQKFHGSSLPISYELKWQYPKHWLRIHTLPSSKRYATNRREKEIIAYRQNAIAEEVLGENRDCLLVLELWRRDAAFFELQKKILKSQFPSFDFEDFVVFRNRHTEANSRVYELNVVWKKGEFDKLLSALADDCLKSVTWMSKDTGALFAPYDGGIDLIITDNLALQALKQKYASWLSSRHDGL